MGRFTIRLPPCRIACTPSSISPPSAPISSTRPISTRPSRKSCTRQSRQPYIVSSSGWEAWQHSVRLVTDNEPLRLLFAVSRGIPEKRPRSSRRLVRVGVRRYYDSCGVSVGGNKSQRRALRAGPGATWGQESREGGHDASKTCSDRSEGPSSLSISLFRWQ